MLIDRTQRGWGLGSLGIFAAALVMYFLEAWIAPQGPRGGSAIGLIFGVLGFGFMIFAAALGARKRVPVVLAIFGALTLHFFPKRFPVRLQEVFANLGGIAKGAVLSGGLLVITTLGPAGVAPFIYYRF